MVEGEGGERGGEGRKGARRGRRRGTGRVRVRGRRRASRSIRNTFRRERRPLGKRLTAERSPLLLGRRCLFPASACFCSCANRLPWVQIQTSHTQLARHTQPMKIQPTIMSYRVESSRVESSRVSELREELRRGRDVGTGAGWQVCDGGCLASGGETRTQP